MMQQIKKFFDFITGMGQVLDTAGSYQKKNMKKSDKDVDAVATLRDWKAVGEDLRAALQLFEKEKYGDMDTPEQGNLPLEDSAKEDSSVDGQIMSTEVQMYFSGPLPPPDIFRRYEQVLPGSADRILALAEEQSRHRRDMEKAELRGEQLRANVGLLFGFIIGMTTIIGGLLLIYFDKQWEGFFLGLGGLVTLVGTFVYGKHKKELDREEKEEELEGETRDS